ncbi:MAG: hypothetical protein ABIU30_18520 [Ferruginibacter sp.]
MKKLILPFALLMALASCKKDAATQPNPDNNCGIIISMTSKDVTSSSEAILKIEYKIVVSFPGNTSGTYTKINATGWKVGGQYCK